MTGSRSKTHPSKKKLLLTLLGISIVALLLPHSWTAGLISLAQVLVPFQDAAATAAEAVAGALTDDDHPVPASEHKALAREKTGLEHQVAALTVRVEDLEKEVGILEVTRAWQVNGHRIGMDGRLVPARIITEDMLPWRSSRLINAGSLQGVQHGSAVVSRYFIIDRGENDGVRSGLAILLREALIGVIEKTGTHTSRVKLLSDVSVERKVRIGRFTEEGFETQDRYFWLAGRGGGVMEIRDVEQRDVENGLIKTGDVVLSAPEVDVLPAAMTIGKVVKITQDRDNPLLAILTVQSPLDEGSLRRVYVYDPEGTTE